MFVLTGVRRGNQEHSLEKYAATDLNVVILYKRLHKRRPAADVHGLLSTSAPPLDCQPIHEGLEFCYVHIL